MKKLLIILGIVVILAGLAGAGYWYWQSKPQVVALNSSDTKTFNGLCTKIENGQLTCDDSLKNFECDLYVDIADRFVGLEPEYPVIGCNKKNISSIPGGVYQLPGNSYVPPSDIDYIIIKDGNFELISSIDQLGLVYAPIESIDEAKAYFSILGKGLLVLDEAQLDKIKNPVLHGRPLIGGKFDVPVDSIQLSQVKSQGNDFVITSYSSLPYDCIGAIDYDTYLLKQDGTLIQQDKQYIWEEPGRQSDCSE